MIKKLLLTLFLVINLFFASAVFGQVAGDYRTNVNTTGNWTTLGSWQYYNGSAWVTPSGIQPQGYPGQYTGTGAVLIQAGHEITMGTADITTTLMSTLTISGTLILDGGNDGGVFTIKTQTIIITAGLTPYANINFANKVTLALPTNATIQVGIGGLPTPGNGTCNNNIEISIGGNALAYCTGTGSPAANYSFTDVINNGGYNFVKASTPTPICGSGSFAIIATATPSTGATIKWYSVASGGTLLSAGTVGNGSTYTTPTISSSTTYYVEAAYSGYTTPRTTVVATVNALPFAYAVTGGGSYCSGGPEVVVGLTNSTLGVSYQLQIGSVNTGDAVAGTGAAITFGPKTTAGTYTVIATNTTTTCTAAMTGSGTIIVGTANTAGTASSSPTPCVNTLMTSITHITTGATGIGASTALPAGVTATWATNTITISGTPTVSGSFRYSIPLTGGCGSANATGTITITPASVGGTVSSNQTICTGSSPANITLLGQTGIIQWQRADNETFTTNLTNIGTNSTTLTSVEIGSLTAIRYFRAVVTSGSCAAATSRTVTVLLNTLPNNTETGFSSSSFCLGNQATITFNANNGSGVLPYTLLYSNDASPLVTYSETITTNSATSFNLSPNPTVSTNYTLISITDTNGCVNSSPIDRTAEATIVPLPSKPTVGTITQPTCTVTTGSVFLSGLPTGNWTINPGGITGSITSKIVSGLAGGTYNFTVTNSSGCTSPVSVGVTITPLVTNNYTGTWSAGSFPPATGGTQNIVFNAGFTATTDLSGCSCQVNSGNVIVSAGKTLTITNEVTVSGGSLIFENNSSLVQINDAAVNTGNITYKRYTTKVKRYDFTYWSSPVAAQRLYDLSPNTLYDKYYGYSPTPGWILYYNGAVTMEVGKGYIARAPQTFSITNAIVDTAPQFIGVPNNGIKQVAVGLFNDYLLGNPYPSAIDADKFLIDNTKTSGALGGTLYFWTHNSPPSDAVVGDAQYNYTANDYASYNLTGGVGTEAVSDLTPGNPDDNKPNGKIAAGQSFFATSSATGGTVTFNNSMRLIAGAPINNSQFFKMNNSKGKSANAIEKNRIWLNLTNDKGAFKQTLIGYVTDATNQYDNAFDGESFDGNDFVDFYSINEAKNLTIQGRVLPFDINDAIPLGYSSTIKGVFSIAIDQVDGVLVSQDIFIEDKSNNVIQNLKQGPYSFSTEVGTFKNRFVLRYVNTSKTLRTGTFKVIENTVLVSSTNKQIKINSSKELINKVEVFDLLGKPIYKKNDVNSNEFVITNLAMDHQLVLVKIVLQNGTTVTKKIVN